LVEEQQRAFVVEISGRYPHLKGHVFTLEVLRDADGNASLRQPRINSVICAKTVGILGQEDSERDPQPRRDD
jgi:hypothetical protein